ncbi:MAG: HNH endonuclease [Chitinophagales bacterium]|nr:HNH endonuclease [Chitinophagales bacterium]
MSNRTWTDEQLIEAVKNSFNISQTLNKLGLNKKSTGNYKTIKLRIKELNLDTSHFKWIGKNLGGFNEIKLDDVLIENSTYLNTSSLKRKLLKKELLKYECYICSINEWRNKKLVLQLDHINGVFNDNRIDNLRLLCPNCHSQTETFSIGTKLLKPKKEKKKIGEYTPVYKNRKVEWLSKTELEKLVWEKPTTHIAKDLGLTDKAVEKWCKIYGINKPPRGYWMKNKIKND